MIFTYPIESARENNWLHDTVLQIITLIHSTVDSGVNVLEWPNIIPEPYRNQLQRKYGLRERFIAYITELKNYESTQRDEILEIILSSNHIEDILSNKYSCKTILDIPNNLRKPLESIFEFSFSLLKSLGVRRIFYSKIYQSIDGKVCPFCGCEYFESDKEEAPHEALDHYLAFDIYPFAGANLYNLVPMGYKCNTLYKKTKNIILDDHNNPRKALFPYKDFKIEINLDNSLPFKGNKKAPLWDIQFVPDAEEVRTWNEVFEIKSRYARDILDVNFNHWITDFKNFAQSREISILEQDSLTKALKTYISYYESMGIRDKAFIKSAVFKMLLRNCLDGNQRLIAFLLSQFGIILFP